MFLLLENVRENLRSNQNMDHPEKRDTEQRQTKHGPSVDTRHKTKTNKTKKMNNVNPGVRDGEPRCS